jgi:exonuclease SbcC
MRLVSLTVSNFRVLKKIRLSFPDAVIGIIGPNGAGKSSLIEAVAWALYGNQAARSGKGEIKSTFAGRYDNVEVCLEFAVNDEKYRVVRRLAGVMERPEVELYRGEASESVGVNETKKYVGELLGLDWKGFLTSFLARQQELNALSDLRPAERRDHLAAMLGIERLDKAIQKVKEDTRSHQRQAAFLENQLAEKTATETRINELEARIRELSTQVKEQEQAVKQVNLALAEAQAAFLKAQQAKAEWLQLKTKIEAEEKSKAHLQRQLDSLRQEAARLADAQKELTELEKRSAGLAEVKSRLETLKSAKSRLELRSQLTAQVAELKDENARIEQNLAQVDNQLAEYDRQLRDIPENVQQLLDDSRQRLEKARHEYSRLQALAGTRKSEIDKLKEQMAAIERLGPESRCDRCLRPLGDSLPQIKAHLSRELSQLEDNLNEILEQSKIQVEDGKRLKKEVKDREVGASLRQELTIKKEACLKERQTLLTRQEESRRKLARVSRQLEEIGEIAFDEAEFSALVEKAKQLEEIRSRCDRLRGGLARLPEVKQAIEETSSRIETADKELSDLKAMLDGLSFDEADFENKRKSFESAQSELEAVKSRHLSLAKELELNRKELEGKQELMRRFTQAAQELEDCRTSQFYGEKLTSLFTQFRSRVIAGIRPTLADISSRLLAEMTDSKYNLIELDDKYNLRVMDYGQYFGVERFSGGEKDLANLCLRLAISLALTESAGLRRSFVILDEVFGSQDNERKELIVKALANLKPRFPQILLITHVDDLKDKVEQLVEVRPTGLGWSELVINGEPVS